MVKSALGQRVAAGGMIRAQARNGKTGGAGDDGRTWVWDGGGWEDLVRVGWQGWLGCWLGVGCPEEGGAGLKPPVRGIGMGAGGAASGGVVRHGLPTDSGPAHHERLGGLGVGCPEEAG